MMKVTALLDNAFLFVFLKVTAYELPLTTLVSDTRKLVGILTLRRSDPELAA